MGRREKERSEVERGGREGEKVGLKAWKRRGSAGRLETGDRGMTEYWH